MSHFQRRCRSVQQRQLFCNREMNRASIEGLESRQLLSVNVLTWHNDLTREGINNNEVTLTPANVNSNNFGELFSYSVTGQVYAQPLYVSNLAIPGKGNLNVVFVVTMNNDVYAFNADSNSGSGEGLIWHVNLGPSATVPSPYIGARYGPDHDTTPLVGITGTPVIDLSTGAMYLDAFTNDVPGQDVYSHHIHALNITTGADKVTPMLVAASVVGNGVGGNGSTVTFAATQQLQRVALTLLNGVLYVGYGAFADTDPYHGWVLGFNETTLQLLSVMNTSPNLLNNATSQNPGESGIWASGSGLASDGTHLFFVTGNGDFENSVGDYGDSFIEIAPDSSTKASPNVTGYGVGVNGFFTPYNQLALANADADLGSGGAMLLPTQSGSYPDEMVGAGKQGTVYLINRDSMGGYSTTTDNVIQEVSLGHGEWGSPAYFNGSIYYHAVGDVLKRFTITNGLLSAAPAASSTITYLTQGSTPSISANGTANGLAWDVQWDATHQVLHAYDATTLAELYNSNQVPGRDQMGAGVKFITPTVADGHVFVGSTGALTVYGELTPVTTAPAAPSNAAASATTASSVTVTWIDNSDNESAFLVERSTDGTNFTQIGMSSENVPTYSDNTVSPSTLYYYRIRATNVIGNSAYTVPSASVMTPAAAGAIDVYHFDEGAGSATVDSGSANNGTLTGATLPQWVSPGEVGTGALSFSGDGVYNQTASESVVAVSNDLSPILGSTSTLDLWVKTFQAGSANNYQSPAITGVDQAGGTNDIEWGTLDATGHIGIYIGNAGGVYSTHPVNDGKWHNIAMTRNATTGLVQIFVDGVLNSSATLDVGSKALPFYLIGALSDVAGDGVTRTGDNYFNGQLDEVRIYNQVLGQSQINSLALLPAAPVLQTATAQSGPVVQLTFTNPSSYALSLEIDRKTGVNGTYAAIATVAPTTTLYDDTNVSTGISYYYVVKAIDTAGTSAISNALGVTPPAPTIVGNYIFYNNSAFDGQNGSSNLTDDNAIAPDKVALLPGQTASYQNITDYSKGINGIMVDIANLVNLPRLDDFIFEVGNNNNPASWTEAPTPTYINSYPGRGPGGSTQITVIWDDNAIQNEWLQVTVLDQPHLNLQANDVFYFGNAIGDTGSSSTSAQVTAADVTRISNNETSSAGLSDPYDLNRDGVVDTTDVSIAGSNQTTPATALQLISLTSAGTLPTVATPASATPGTVTGTTTALSVLGADSAGEPNLTYTWSTVGTPPAAVSFSANGTNAAKNTTTTFITAGTYNFQVTITNAAQLSVTSNVTVQVSQATTSLAVTPGITSVAVNSTTQFTAAALDQFGIAMATQPTFVWSVSSGNGSISSSGLFTSSRTVGSSTVSAAITGGPTGSANVTVFFDALAWYKADVASGTTLFDSTGSNQTATLAGAYSFTAGVSGNALTLAGGYASLPAGIVGSLNDFTISTWVKVTALANWARIFDFGTGTNTNMFLTADAGGTNALRFSITITGGGGEQQLDGPALALNTWIHVAVTLAGNTATLYVNGIAVASNNGFTIHPTNLGDTTQNYIGKSQYPADPALTGSIDDFRIYTRALSAQQVLQLAAPGLVNAPAASPTPVTATSTNLSVLGSDVTAGESALVYTWSTIGASPAAAAFSINGTNAAKNTLATFTMAGTYTFQVAISNPVVGVTTTATLTVTVNQTASGISVVPASAVVVPSGTYQFTASAVDQFGNAMATQPAFTWSVTSGSGSISAAGLYTAPANTGSATIRAAIAGGASATASINITTAVAWYQADSSSGNSLIDSSGNNKNGTLTVAYSYTAGVSGNALTLNGGYASLPTGIVSSLNDFTIAAWVKVTTAQNWARIFDFGSGTGINMFLTPDAGVTNALLYAIVSSGNSYQELNGPALPVNTWTHIAVTQAGNTATIYVNGNAVASSSTFTIHPSSLGNTTQNYLGKSQYIADPNLQGSIDDFRIYGVALSAQQIQQLALPAVVTPAAASASPVTTTSTNLSVLASDVTAGESALTYTWASIGSPPAPVIFSANGTNAAKNTVVTFLSAGNYSFRVTIVNPAAALSITSVVNVTVNQTQSAIAVSPPVDNISDGQTGQFIATANDQFGTAMIVQPTISWSLDAGSVGSVNSSGAYTAPSSGPGSATIRATSGSTTGTAAITVVLSIIAGTTGNDNIRLVRNGSTLEVYYSGSLSYSVPFASLDALTVNTQTGNDAVTIDYSGGASPVPIDGITVNGGGGSDSLTLISPSGINTAVLSASSMQFDGSTINYAGLSFALGNSTTFNSLSIGTGALLRVSGNSVISVGQLSVPGTFDLNTGGLILQGGGAAGFAQITSLLKSGFNAGNGYWNGPSGIVSSAAANDSKFLTTLGVMVNSTGNAFENQPSSVGDVLVKYTYYGDADLNGLVNGADYQQIDGGFGGHATGWSNGDFNYDGVVDGSDYSLIDNAFNQTNSTGAAPLALIASAEDPLHLAQTISKSSTSPFAGRRQIAPANGQSILATAFDNLEKARKAHDSAAKTVFDDIADLLA